MHRSLAFVAIAMLAASFAMASGPSAGRSLAQEPLPLEALLGRVQTTYRGLTDFRARFRHTRTPRAGLRPVVSDGTWYVRTPGRLRLEYDSPARVFVADGLAMYWYLPEDNQVQVLDARSLDPNQQPILYLTGEGDLVRDFEVSGTEWGEILAPGNVQLRLQPRVQDARFTHLVVEVEPKEALIARLVLFSLLGETSEFTFTDLETDVGLAEELFQFAIPPGAQVEHLGQ